MKHIYLLLTSYTFLDQAVEINKAFLSLKDLLDYAKKNNYVINGVYVRFKTALSELANGKDWANIGVGTNRDCDEVFLSVEKVELWTPDDDES